jgi:hypothetical protein
MGWQHRQGVDYTDHKVFRHLKPPVDARLAPGDITFVPRYGSSESLPSPPPPRHHLAHVTLRLAERALHRVGGFVGHDHPLSAPFAKAVPNPHGYQKI